MKSYDDKEFLTRELQNKTITQLSHEIGIPRTSLQKICNKHGLRRPRINADVADKLKNAQYLENELSCKSLIALATELGVSSSTLLRACQRLNVDTSPVSDETHCKLDDKQWLERELGQKSLSKVARELGVSRPVVSRYLKRHSIVVSSLPNDLHSKLRDKDWLQENLQRGHCNLAKELDISLTTLRKYARMLDIESSKLPANAAHVLHDHQVLAERLRYQTQTALAADLGIHSSTISNYCIKYGIEVSCFDPEQLEKLKPDHLLSEIQTRSLNEIATDIGIHYQTLSRYFQNYGINIPKSKYENEIALWLQSMGVKYEQNTRRIIAPKELDFYLPDYRVAIEFNGLYWHSEKFIDRNYHREKYEAAQRAGITLMMIYEDEWRLRSSAIRDSISHRLGLGTRGVGARKMTIASLTSAQANSFFEKHHIQGATAAIMFAVGGFHDGKLVSAMSFGRQRRTSEYELTRFCTDGRSHPGSFSRLFLDAVNTHAVDKVVTFADLRYSTGEVYRSNNFTQVKEIPPDYRYVVNGAAIHKSNFTRARIENKFNIDMTNLTESEAMSSLGYFRIYDCGKIKFEWQRPDQKSDSGL